MLACIRGKEKMVNLLIDHGADVQAVDAVTIFPAWLHYCWFIHWTQRGEACLNYTETLRNRVILERILREYQKLEISVDVESLVRALYRPLTVAITFHSTFMDVVVLTFVLYTTTDRTQGVPLSLLPVSVEPSPLLSCSWSIAPTQMAAKMLVEMGLYEGCPGLPSKAFHSHISLFCATTHNI